MGMESVAKWGKRLIVAGAITGGAVYCAVKSYQKVISDHRRPNKEDEELRCRKIYAGIQQSCFTTVSNLLNRMNDLVKEELNTESITAQLQENPANKIALWETLKFTSFSSAVVSSCVCSMVTVLVRVQLSVMAGSVCCHGNRMNEDRKKSYLLVMFEMFEEGLRKFVTVVRRASEKVLVSYSLKHQITLDLAHQILTSIVDQTAAGSRTSSVSWMLQYMVPEQSTVEIPDDITDLMAATEDALEIKDTQDILIGLIDRSLSHFTHLITDSFHSIAQNSSSLPLARAIPLISDHSPLMLNSQHNHLLKEMVNDVELMSCCRNIFEAFSSELE